jgi:hypothetical protein
MENPFSPALLLKCNGQLVDRSGQAEPDLMFF